MRVPLRVLIVEDPEAEHKIDGIAGATITTRGVTDMIRYWLGPNGFKQLLERLADNTSAGRSARSDGQRNRQQVAGNRQPTGV